MSESNWIKVEDSLPESHQSVLVFDLYCGSIDKGWYNASVSRHLQRVCFQTSNGMSYDITHWQPLPDVPDNPERVKEIYRRTSALRFPEPLVKATLKHTTVPCMDPKMEKSSGVSPFSEISPRVSCWSRASVQVKNVIAIWSKMHTTWFTPMTFPEESHRLTKPQRGYWVTHDRKPIKCAFTSL